MKLKLTIRKLPNKCLEHLYNRVGAMKWPFGGSNNLKEQHREKAYLLLQGEYLSRLMNWL